MSYLKSLESRGKPPAKRDHDTRGGNANSKRGRNNCGRGARGRYDARPSTDKKPNVYLGIQCITGDPLYTLMFVGHMMH